MMGMMPPKPKLASIILSSKLGGKEVEGKQDEVQSDDSVGLEAAADKIMKALEGKDKKALVEGLKDFMAMSELEEPEESEEMV